MSLPQLGGWVFMSMKLLSRQKDLLKLSERSTLKQSGFVLLVIEKMQLQKQQYLVLPGIGQIPHVVDSHQIQEDRTQDTSFCQPWTTERVQLNAISDDDRITDFVVIGDDDESRRTASARLDVNIIRLQLPRHKTNAVSYTHLTLPTNREV